MVRSLTIALCASALSAITRLPADETTQTDTDADFLIQRILNPPDTIAPAGEPAFKNLQEKRREVLPRLKELLATSESEAHIYNLLSFLKGYNDKPLLLEQTRALLRRKPIAESGPLYSMAVGDIIRQHGASADVQYFLPALKMEGSQSYTQKLNALLVIGEHGESDSQAAIDTLLATDARLVPNYPDEEKKLIRTAQESQRKINSRLN